MAEADEMESGQTRDDSLADSHTLEARLGEIRDELEALDGDLIRLVGRRRDLVLEVGRVKEGLVRPVLDPPREA